MGHTGDERFLVQAAAAVLAGEDVLAAGIFGLQELVWAQVAGGTLGGLAAGGLSGDPLATGLGAGVGGRLAKEDAARKLGMTLQLLVAVTGGHIVVLNWEAGEQAGREVMRFDRAATSVEVSGFGLSRIVTLREAGGAEVTLHATAAPYRPQSKPDGHVLKVLEGSG